MKTFFTLLLSIAVVAAGAQTKIEGKVSDTDGHPVSLVNIFLQDSYDGTSTDADGNFEFTTTETGEHVLLVKLIGYKEVQRPVVLNGKSVIVEIELEEQINELNAITISAGTFTASDASRRTVFRAVDIATTAGATADIAGALNTLPGTQKVGESGRLFVRGGDGRETRTFIDGMLVLDAYGPSAPNTPSRGRFLPFMFKGTSFSTGGYSAEYGQALSSALVLDSKDESETTRTDIGILSVGGDVAHTQSWDGGSMAGKVQYTNLRPYTGIINQRIDWKTAPASLEGIGAFRQRAGKNGMIKAYGNFNRSSFSLYNHDIDDPSKKQLYDLVNNYRYLNGIYKNSLNTNWMIRAGLSHTFIRNDISVEQNNVLETEKSSHVKTVVEGNVAETIELKSGVEMIQRSYRSGSAAFDETIAAGFAEVDIYASNNFVTRSGARLEYNSLIHQWRVDPRLSLAYKTGTNGQVSFAYGKFRQSPKNEYLRQENGLSSERADHFILNYQRVENERTFRIETYYKSYNDLVKIENGDQLTNNGIGYARGAELFWRDNRSVRSMDYWVSYSFLDTERDYENFPVQAVPSFASRHNLSVVLKYFVQKLKTQLGTTYSFASGRPYQDPNHDQFNGRKTPAYQDLSFNMAYLPKPYLIVYFSCTNVLGRNNIFGYEYSSAQNENGQYNGRPVRQAAPRFLFLGIFITLSKDKLVNQLPSL